MTVLRLIVSFGVPLSVGFLNSAATARSVREWYPTLRKPWFTPPNWLFGPVWTVLYLLMGWAVYQVWSLPAGTPGKGLALGLFALQLALNAAWSPIFFFLRSPGRALPVLVALDLAVIATILAFRTVSDTAWVILLPYLVWLMLATALNLRIWQLNR
jgi:benzodiazapine receptor